MTICSFELSGHFATFRKPDTNEVYLTYNNPPYAAMLGILGSVVGLSGYSQTRTHEAKHLPQFYTELSGLWLSFLPLFSGRPVFPKHMITYNNYHGYGFESGCFQITEQIMIFPKWKVYLYDEHGRHNSLADNIENGKTVFTPYLGKNEFRAEIGAFDNSLTIKEDTLVTEEFVKREPKIKLDSVVLLEPVEKHPIVKSLSEGLSLEDYFANPEAQYPEPAIDEYAIFEHYPYALSPDVHYKTCLSAFTNWELDTSTIRRGSRILNLSDGKKIQMFNGGLE